MNICSLFLFLTATLASISSAQIAKPDSEALIGDWRGNSICVVRESACHDEKALYHVAGLPDKPGRYSMRLDKIVDDKHVTMGTTECSYAPETHALTCEFPRGVLHFTLQGNKLEGTMNLQDG